MTRDNAIVNERRRYVDLRDRFSMAGRRHVTEKYYDCLQCAEQCRHADNNPGSSNSNNNNNSGSRNINGALVVNRTIRSNYRLPTSNVALYLNKEIPTSPPDDVRRIRTTRNNLAKSLVRHQSAHPTPAKKRSSLARPVRVHDSFVQPRRLMAAGDDHLQDPGQDQDPRDQAGTRHKNPFWWQEQPRRDQPNTSSYTYRDTEERTAEDGTGWPIRLRLEQMLELTLPQTKRRRRKKKKKKTAAAAAATMMLMKQQQHSRHGFKDTERLLKVLSINNVDQDNRYNVKRCSVM